MNILMVNQNWFAEAWRKEGHQVVTAAFVKGFDIRLPVPMEHISSILKRMPDGFVPDRIVIHDNSSPILVAGLEETEIPTIFYSVDTHHHAAVHKYVAHLVDEVAVAQKDFIQEFELTGRGAMWIPLWASKVFDASESKRHKAVFVGTLNPSLNPARVRFVQALQQLAPLELFRGAFWDIYPFADVVLNQTVKGDLNFRVFEALMSGAALVTEESGNGLFDLFVNGTHLVGYKKDNEQDAAEKINMLLSDTQKARQIGMAGREIVIDRHLESHRAAQLMMLVQRATKRSASPIRFLSGMIVYHATAARYMKTHRLLALKALASALHSAKVALEVGEPISDEIALHLCVAAIRYGQETGSDAADDLLKLYHERYPVVPLFTLAIIRSYLNKGDIASAERVAREFSDAPAQEVFDKVHTAFESIFKLSGAYPDSVYINPGEEERKRESEKELEVPFVYKTHMT